MALFKTHSCSGVSYLNKSCLSAFWRWVKEEVIWLDAHSKKGRWCFPLLPLPSAAWWQVEEVGLVGRICSCRESVSVSG